MIDDKDAYNNSTDSSLEPRIEYPIRAAYDTNPVFLQKKSL